MITRRAMAFLRKRDWAGMLFELLVVALGVLLGIEAANWNERRLRAIRQEEVMKQLAAELDESVEEADKRLADARQLVDDLGIVRTAVDSGRLDPRDVQRFKHGICQTNSWWQPAWRLSTVDQLIASGDLDLIADPALRSALVGYRDTVAVIREDIRGLGATAVRRADALDPYIDYGPTGKSITATSEADLVDGGDAFRCDPNLAGLHTDPAARNAIKAIQSQQTGILGNQMVIREQAIRLRNLLKAHQ